MMAFVRSLFAISIVISGVTVLASHPHVDAALEGYWEGRIVYKRSEQAIRLEFWRDSIGLTGKVDLPSQYASGYALRAVQLQGETISFEFPAALPRTVFHGVVEKDRIHGELVSIEGSDTMRGRFELLPAQRTAPAFRTEEMEVSNGEILLRGTLLIPLQQGPHPLVVLIHGSGPQTRESYIRYFAERLAGRGAAALIYDKRNTGNPNVPPWLQGQGTFDQLAGDALSWVNSLRQRSDIQEFRIGLWGFSQGAWVAPIAASKSKSIGFAILLSGGGVSPAEQELYDDEVKLRSLGFSESEITRAIDLLRLADTYIRTASDMDWEILQNTLAAARKEPWFSHLDRFPLVLPREAPAWTGLRSTIDYDPRPILSQLRFPLLVVLGENDELTPAAETAQRIRQAAATGGNSAVTIHMIPGADHGLMVKPEDARSWLEKKPAEGWVDDMVDWIVKVASQ